VSLNTFVQQAVQGARHRKGGGKDWGRDWSREWSRGWGGGPERGQSQHRVQGWYEG
jgi:hypothetical protein